MKNLIFAIYDSKARAYHQPFFSPTLETGQRAFMSSVQESNSYLHKFSEDYTLFQIGEWDDVNGKINPLENAINLGLATNYKG